VLWQSEAKAAYEKANVDISTMAAARDGGANGSIIGHNTFQRPRTDALFSSYQGKM